MIISVNFPVFLAYYRTKLPMFGMYHTEHFEVDSEESLTKEKIESHITSLVISDPVNVDLYYFLLGILKSMKFTSLDSTLAPIQSNQGNVFFKKVSAKQC